MSLRDIIYMVSTLGVLVGMSALLTILLVSLKYQTFFNPFF